MTTEAWTQLGTGLALAFVAFMQRYDARKAEKARIKLQERVLATETAVVETKDAVLVTKEAIVETKAAVVETKVVAEKVHQFVTNGTLGHVKNALAIASRALAVLSKDPDHDKAAIAAELDYATHKLKETKEQLVSEETKQKDKTP